MKKIWVLFFFISAVLLSGCGTSFQMPDLTSAIKVGGQGCDKDDTGQPIPAGECHYWQFYQSIKNGMTDSQVIDLAVHYKINNPLSSSFVSGGSVERPSMGLVRIFYDKGIVVHKRWENFK